MNNCSDLEDNCTYSGSSPQESYLEDSAVQRYVNGILGGVIFLLNLITIISILISKTVNKKDKVSLSVIISYNTLIGFQILFVRLIPTEYTSEHFMCRLRIHTAVIFGFSITFSNVMMTFERFVCIVIPLTYKQYVTWKRLLIYSCGICFFSIALSWIIYDKTFWNGTIETKTCLFTLGGQTGFAILGLMICCAAVLNMALYAYIITVTKRQIRQIAATMVGGNTPYTRDTFVTKQDIRLTFTVGINLVAFVVSYFPIGAYMTYYGIFSKDPNRELVVTLITLFMFNSFVNPIVYIWRLRGCRQEIIKKLCGPFTNQLVSLNRA